MLVRRDGIGRGVLLAMLLAVAAGCSSELRQVQRCLRRGDLPAAAAAAGDDRYALQEVALDVLARGLSDAATREASARGLVAGGEAARGTLRHLTERQEEGGAAWALAAEALVSLGHRRTRARLERWIGSPDPVVRAAVVRALGPEAEDDGLVSGALADTAAAVRLAAVEVLGRRREEEGGAGAAELLAEASRRDPAAEVRAGALRALGRVTRGPLLLETARAALQAEQGEGRQLVRLAAISALGTVDDINSAEVLLLEVLADGEPAEQLRAASALSSYGNERGHEYLRSALTDRAVAIAGGAAVAAGSVGGPLRDALVAALDRPEPEVRLHVAASLLRIGERERAVAELRRLVELPGWIGLQAAIALARQDEEGSRAAVRLASALQDESAELRAFAAMSSGFLESGWELAARVLGDPDPAVRVAAATAVLRSLGRRV